jgi:hypothetical protein
MSITALGPIRRRAGLRAPLRTAHPDGAGDRLGEGPALAKSANWSKAHLSFNENHNNIDIGEGDDASER